MSVIKEFDGTAASVIWAGGGIMRTKEVPSFGEFQDLQRRKADSEEAIKNLGLVEAGLIDIITWSKKLSVLEKAEGSVYHQLVEGPVVDYDDMTKRMKTIDPSSLSGCQVFVVEHDWAAAFKGATDFDGDFRAPYERCCFEFKITGKRWCVLLIDDVLTGYARTKAGWVFPIMEWRRINGEWRCALTLTKVDIWRSLFEMFIAQIKAICVALDAEVAVSDVVRAPYKLNKQRSERGKTPLVDYHVVSLARRSRAAPLPTGAEPKWHVRLHFRRGHWRHYEDHKTWIKWMLVGDPDLGFIDKHYKL